MVPSDDLAVEWMCDRPVITPSVFIDSLNAFGICPMISIHNKAKARVLCLCHRCFLLHVIRRT